MFTQGRLGTARLGLGSYAPREGSNGRTVWETASASFFNVPVWDIVASNGVLVPRLRERRWMERLDGMGRDGVS